MALSLRKDSPMRSVERCRPTRSDSRSLEQMRAVSREGGGVGTCRQAARRRQADRARTSRPAARPGIVRRARRVRHEPRRDRDRIASSAMASSPDTATIDGRTVFVFSQDFTVFGGSLSEAYAEKICKVMDLAMKVGAPIIGLNDSGGARIQEGVVSLGGYADIFLRNVLASGVVPQISVVLGPCAGGAVYSPAITDFTVMVEGTSYMFVTGPDVVKTVTHEDVDREFLGGADDPHDAERRRAPRGARRSRRARRGARIAGAPAAEQPGGAGRSSRRPIRRTGWTSSSTPSSPTIRGRRTTCTTSCAASSTTATSSRSSPAGRRTSSSGSRRLGGRSVGIVAQQPAVLAGALDIDASVKAARFVRTCDAFNVPLVYVRRCPGFPARCRPGTRRHHPPRREAALRVLPRRRSRS